MKASAVIAADLITDDELESNKLGLEASTADAGSLPDRIISELRSSRPDAAAVFDLEVLIKRHADGLTRGRAANLPIPEIQAATVREALQFLIERARALMNECLANGKAIPWVAPASAAAENESRFIVPLELREAKG